MTSLHSTELSRALFEESGDALFLFDPESDHLLEVNPTAERLTGLDEGGALPHPPVLALLEEHELARPCCGRGGGNAACTRD